MPITLYKKAGIAFYCPGWWDQRTEGVFFPTQRLLSCNVSTWKTRKQAKYQIFSHHIGKHWSTKILVVACTKWKAAKQHALRESYRATWKTKIKIKWGHLCVNYFNKWNEAEECPVLFSLHEKTNLLLKEKESYIISRNAFLKSIVTAGLHLKFFLQEAVKGE